MNKLNEAYVKALKTQERKGKLKVCLENFICPNCTSDLLEQCGSEYSCPDCGWEWVEPEEE